ncbi:MAG: hydrolase [Oscillospiraceae bacterium]|nr:hydrolase [Oscillospiraceae bacterium]
MDKEKKLVPSYEGALRSHMIQVPTCIAECSGIRIFGRRIKSLVFSTDAAIIKNINADAVIAVYPFTPQPAITRAVLEAADMPVLAGIGGGTTKGPRVIRLGCEAEDQGAIGVVVNAPIPNEVIRELKEHLEIPIIVTVVSDRTDIAARVEAGANILNVSAAADTARIVASIRQKFPHLPIIATGGPTEESILRTIEAGANAITYTPPTTGELFAKLMVKYREAIVEEATSEQ